MTTANLGFQLGPRFASAGWSRWQRLTVRLVLLGLPLFLVSVAAVQAQITGGIIQGIVTDETGATLANAQVTVTDVGTKVSSATQTNETGLYVYPSLNPGTYDLTVTAPGFKTYVHRGIELLIQQSLRVDVPMGLGSVQETVQVSGLPSLLDTETAATSTVISSTLIQDLPVAGRNPLMANRLVMGANSTFTQNLFSRPVDSFAASDVMVNGTPTQSQDFLLDGVSDVYGGGAAGFLPPTYAVQDIRVQTFALTAEVGQTGGSVTTIETKSGENALHGNLWYYHHDQGLDANSYFNNRFNQPKSVRHDNQFGGSIGGPVHIPGLYNGKDRTFFFADVELTRNITNNTTLETVPTQLEREGDFSQTFAANGDLIQIFNPYSLHTDPISGQQVRDAFVDNKIPSGMINPLATSLINAVIPLPNLPGSVNNLFFTQNWPFISNSVHFRLDHRIGDKDSLFGTFGWIKDNESYPAFLPSGVSGFRNLHWDYIYAFGYTHTFSPTRTLELRAGVHRDHQDVPPLTANNFIDQLNLPSNLTDIAAAKVFPIFTGTGFGGTVGYNATGNSFITPNYRASLIQIIRRHTLKFGYEGRIYRTFSFSDANESGNFSFTPFWTRGPSPNVSSATAGVDIADLLLGTPTLGSIATNASNASQSIYNALYLQDDWRVSHRLTLNLGLRWDVQTPSTERFNKANRGFDFTDPNPIEDQVNANLGANPIPGISSLDVIGGLQFAGVGGQPRQVYDKVSDNFMPRIGAAYQLTPRTVLRGGYGLFYSQLTQYATNAVNQAQLPLTQLGFSSSTGMTVTDPSGLPLSTLSNPFPNGQIQPVGASLGLGTLLGQSIITDDIHNQRPRVQQFQLSLQRQLFSDMVVNVAYVGSRTDRLPVTQDVDPIPEDYATDASLSPGGVFPQVTNPFAGVIPVGTLSLPTVSLPQLLKPFPEFTGVSISNRPIGKFHYDALQVSVTKRFSRGLTFLANYTWSKTLTRNIFLDPYQPLISDVSPLDRPQMLVIGGRWELPVGKGRSFGGNLPAAVQYAIGGWNVSWITSLLDGFPTGPWSGAVMTHTPQHVDRSISQWFDTSAFAPMPPFTLPTLLPYSAQIRQPGSKNTDLTITKSFPIRERFRFDLGVNLYNAFNTPIFGVPTINVLSPAFGSITSQANNPRWVMLNGSLSF